MGYIYLIGESDTENHYKIGMTKCKDINKRAKQLQTGNSEPLFIKAYFETEHPYKLEKMLHNRFKESNLNGEWFELTKDDVSNFKGICEHYQGIIKSLEENPFYFKAKK